MAGNARPPLRQLTAGVQRQIQVNITHQFPFKKAKIVERLHIKEAHTAILFSPVITSKVV